MAAYVTVSGGLAREDLRQAARIESEAIGRQRPSGWGVLADRVAEALQSGDGARAVEPDLVGEAFLLRVWGGADSEGCRAVVRASKARGRQVAASVVRAAQDFCVGEAARSEPLAWLDALIAEGKGDLALLWQIEGELPSQTLALRERTVEVYAMLAAALRERADADQDVRPERARVLNNLGNRLGDLGRREEALQATDEAVGLHRQLASQCPDAFLPDLASSLNNLGNRLSALGRREEALQASDEAVRIRRRLAAQRPDAFLPDLATSLNNLGLRLSDLGRREEALQATDEAVRIRRQLAAQRPDAFLPDLAISLNNLGAMLGALGRRALQATDEAVGLYRQLAAQHPDAFLPALASSLDNRGGSLRDLGRREHALQATDEAVGHYRQLAAQRPDAFLPGLATSLGAKGAVLGEIGTAAEAAGIFREGVDRLKPLFLSWPNAFQPLMRTLVRNYLLACETAGLEVDSDLLGDIVPLLSDEGPGTET